jgi:hypothetical protein
MDDDNSMSPRDRVGRFQKDFIGGCLSFITIAATVKGDTRDSEEIFSEMMDPIIGNRNRNTTGFDQIMPEMYKKVIEYCHEAIDISDDIENKEII